MNSDINGAAANVIELTDNVAATAVDLQNATQAVRTARLTAASAARHPGRLAAVAAGMLLAAAVLGVRREPWSGMFARWAPRVVVVCGWRISVRIGGTAASACVDGGQRARCGGRAAARRRRPDRA